MKTKELKSNCSVLHIPLTTRLLGFGVGICFGLASVASAQTLVSGNISGTWSPSGNPYVVTGDATVPSGQILTIQPGTIVWIGSNVTITASGGTISAIGTPTQRITFQAPVAGSYYWKTISLNDPPGTTNRFHYCDFINAQTAISVVINNNTGYLLAGAEMFNCTFSNCVSQAFYGNCGVNVGLNPIIKNCTFSGTSNGCVMIFWFGGQANPNISGNIFQNLTGSAFLMTVGDGRFSGGQPMFLNNTIVNCFGGVNATDPWNATVQDNIFYGCTNAMMLSGSLSQQVSYNDFYGNATNFTGYSGNYGPVVFVNRNGTPCDLLFNIYQNPLFTAANDFHLTTSSSCVNAGTPNSAFANMCIPPSIATNFPDLGAYGGPDACNWLDTVPMLPAQLSLTKSNSFIWLNWGAIPRSSYQVQYISTNLDATSGTNRWLTNTTLIPVAKPVSIAVSPYPTTNSTGFYRVRSLGRTPGN